MPPLKHVPERFGKSFREVRCIELDSAAQAV
jgi:hypothetical protein